jgi:hypothetical protein
MLLVPSRRYRSAVIIVAGSVHARPDSIDQVLALSLAHVRRSRTEPGCLAHSVHRDCEDALRLVFIERAYGMATRGVRQNWRICMQPSTRLAQLSAVPSRRSGAFLDAFAAVTWPACW